jgi:hypothetical protein
MRLLDLTIRSRDVLPMQQFEICRACRTRRAVSLQPAHHIAQ